MTQNEFLDNHTLFPLITIYDSERVKLKVKSSSVSTRLDSLNFCPACMIEAVKSNGWAYIKRHWTVPHVMACIEHQKALINASSVNCGCFPSYRAKWFENFLAGCCSECGHNFWYVIQKDPSNADLLYAKIIQSAIASRHPSYQAKNNEKLHSKGQFMGGMFNFRVSRISYVLHRLQVLKGVFAYPDSRTGIKELTDIEKQLISTLYHRITAKWEGLEKNFKISGMPCGDEPSPSDMTPEVHGKYLDSWIEKNGVIKPHLLTLLCDRQLRAVDMNEIKPYLALRLRRMEMAETREFRLMKMIEKVKAGNQEG